MHLVVDVGNTETVAGVFRPAELEPTAHWRYATPVPRTPDELRVLHAGFLDEAGLAPAEIERVVLGSVVPIHTDLLRRAFSRLGPGLVHVVGPEVPLPIRLDVEEPWSVGADRIVNTLAAAHLFHRDTVVVDFGTATTYDCITGEGVFLGGVIAPGLRSGQDWLHRHTAKLPGVELRSPQKVIGRRTETCLESGLFYSVVDAVDGIVARIREEWERPDALIVATGGHATVVAEHSRTIHEVHPHLTLVGLELAGRCMAEDGFPRIHSEAPEPPARRRGGAGHDPNPTAP